MAKTRAVHTSLRIPEDDHQKVLLYCQQHAISNVSDALRRLIEEGLGSQPPELIVCHGIANQEQFEALLGKLTDWINVLRDVKNSLRKTMPVSSADPKLHEQVKKWRVTSDKLLEQVEALRTQVTVMSFRMARIDVEDITKLREHRKELVAELKALRADAQSDPKIKRKVEVREAVIGWLSAFGV